MRTELVHVLRDQIRGVSGALLVVGATFHYTMETWWLGWTLPLEYLVGYAAAGLGVVVVITRNIGFHERDERTRSGATRSLVVDFAEILVQSFVASYTILLVLGIIDLSSSPNTVVRLGLIEVVPLGFGAALANRLFRQAEEGEAQRELKFPQNLALFAVGALFVASTIAPTQEMELISVHMKWVHHLVLVALTVILVYLVLFELEFQGQQSRAGGEWRYQAGVAFLVYFVGVCVSFFLLLGFGHFIDASLALVYQETVVLAFPASLGAAAAEVVI